MTITFEELRAVKHSLPTGSVNKMATILNIAPQTIRNYFGGTDFERGKTTGFHIQPGPKGGYVSLVDTSILNLAKQMISESRIPQGQRG